MASHARLCRGEEVEASRCRLVQKLQVAVMRGVARQLLRRITHLDEQSDLGDEGDAE